MSSSRFDALGWWACILVAALFIPAVALGARYATVDDKDVVVFKGPSAKSEVIAHLRKGQRLHASNYPTEGFYKVRTAAGQIGWVKADVLDLEPVPGGASSQQSPPQP